MNSSDKSLEFVLLAVVVVDDAAAAAATVLLFAIIAACNLFVCKYPYLVFFFSLSQLSTDLTDITVKASNEE